MNIVSGIVVFLLTWWTVLFMTLPIGANPPETIEKGHEPGAPAKPQLLKKFLLTTGLTIMIWGMIYWLVESDLISFHEMAREMAGEDM